MMDSKRDPLGQTVQDYVRFVRGEPVDEPRHDLGTDVLERIEMLGLDADRLLEVAPEEVMATLQALEREAEQEDARVRKTANRVRGRERAK